MEEIVEHVRIDSSGRVVIPTKARRAAGIKEGDMMLIASHGEIILKQPEKNKKQVQEWQKEMLSYHLTAKGISGGKSKWISEDYARKKLGL